MTIKHLKEHVRAMFLVLAPLRCMACQNIMTSVRSRQLCDGCVSTFVANTGKRCRRCDLPGGQHACLQCPVDLGAITQMRLPLRSTRKAAAILEAGRKTWRAEIWLQLASIIAADRQAQALAQQALCIVPVPSDLTRLWQRGFSPSARLARYVARAWQMKIAYVLKVTRPTPRQGSCTPARRYRNMTAAFTCVKPAAHTVALIDDYVVTGATVHAAARALLDAGAKRIIVLGAVRGTCNVLKSTLIA